MSRRPLVAALLAVLTSVLVAAPGVAPRAAAASCSNWTSQVDPPPTIRVYRHATGAVETVDFGNYTRNVLSREWIGSWTAESLRSGAVAVKSYAWYQVLHWRGGMNAANQCFDLRDDTVDQVYDPSKPTWNTASAAVDATWATRVLKSGAIFPTYYNAGDAGEACGANANGWRMYQWGTQACGLDGKTAAQILLTYYYPNVTVTDAPGSDGTPSPSPSATPVPTPTPTPVPTATPAATPTPVPSGPPASATPVPSPVPTAAPTPIPTAAPTPLPTPPPVQELPGGGQSGIEGAAAPPPPPPSDPEPVVASPLATGWVDSWELRSPALLSELCECPYAGIASASMPAPPPADQRLAQFRSLWDQAAQRLLASLMRGFRTDRGLALLFRSPGS